MSWRKTLPPSVELENLDKGVEQEMEDAVRFAEESPFPAYEELFTNIYVDN
jgi:TPP-dependent pyruvate/acetoin dehydrogenase alpha subunit